MPLTLLRHATQKPPVGPLKLDPGHTLSNGLAFALVLNEYGSQPVEDHIGRNPLSFNGSAAWGSASRGPAVMLPSSGASYLTTTNGPVDTPFTGPITCLFRGQVNTGSQYNGFLSKCGVDGGLTDTPFDFRTDNSAAPKLSIVRTGGGAPAGYDSVSTISLGTPQTYVMVAYTSLNDGLPSFYIDGVDAGAAFNFDAGAAGVTGNRYEIRVGRRPDGGVQIDGNCECAYVWSRALTAAEVAWVTAEPYCMFQGRTMQRWLFFPAAAAAPVPQMTEPNTTANQAAAMR